MLSYDSLYLIFFLLLVSLGMGLEQGKLNEVLQQKEREQ